MYNGKILYQYYIALGQCKKGRTEQHKAYCRYCGKCVPRERVRCMNKKSSIMRQEEKEM